MQDTAIWNSILLTYISEGFHDSQNEARRDTWVTRRAGCVYEVSS